MKPFLKQFVLGTCVMFTIFMTLSLPTAYYYAGLSGADTQGLTITLTLLVACIGFSFLQGFWFSGLILKKLAYPLRLTGFAVTSAGMLFACGWFGNWFPHEIEVVALHHLPRHLRPCRRRVRHLLQKDGRQLRRGPRPLPRAEPPVAPAAPSWQVTQPARRNPRS